MLIKMQRTRLAWPENDSRLLKNSEENRDDECRGQETRIRMIREIFEEN